LREAAVGLDLDQVRGRAALLSPFDRLAHDHKRAMEMFGDC
jgi:uncharacterized protein YcaQ